MYGNGIRGFQQYIRGRGIRILLVVVCSGMAVYSTAFSQVQIFTDESLFIAELYDLGYQPLIEDFDGSDWDHVRSNGGVHSAPYVTSKGITWTGTDEVTTGQGPARTGWAVYDHPGGDPDILYGSSINVLYGIGGWFKTSTPYIFRFTWIMSRYRMLTLR